MILKDKDRQPLENKYEIAGDKAERQMAFYLKREFGDSKDIYIINDLRLVDEDDVAQIDTLLIHPFGFIIIESKSVVGTIKVNKYGEWSRIYDGKEMGIASPIEQANRQKKFLLKYLNRYGKNLFKQNLINKFFKANYEDLKFDIFIAISDSGIVNRDGFESNIVLKADNIPRDIRELIDGYYSDFNSLNPLKIPKRLGDDSLKRIGRFLKDKHKRRETTKNSLQKSKIDAINTKKVSKRVDKSKNTLTCSKCKSSNIYITYGKYGYYFKCKDCNGNTGIKEYCPKCNKKMKISKEGDKFYKICEECNTKQLFFVNK